MLTCAVVTDSGFRRNSKVSETVTANAGGVMGAVGPRGGWGTWEELILGGAVLRHGTRSWNVVASELRTRTRVSRSFTPEVCKAKYEDLQKRYSGSTDWFEELKKRRVEELKRELAKSEDSIGSLELKIKCLEAEKQSSNQADYGLSQTESPLPALNADGTESSSKDVSKEEQHSAGSFTKDTRTINKTWLCERHPQEMEVETKPDVSVSSDKDLSMDKAGYVTIRKRRGQRKRKDCNLAVKEGSVGESDNLGSSNVVSITQKETSTIDCDPTVITDSGVKKQNGGSSTTNKRDGSNKRDGLIEIFQCIARSEPAAVFRTRMDSQKRARYRKVIKQHLDIGTIRARIVGHSIKSAKELFRDLLLLSNNALVFYSRRTREYKSALSLRQLVMREYKLRCRVSCHEATSAFLPFNPPVKPRSIRPRPRPRPPPCKDKPVEEKLADVENVVAVSSNCSNGNPRILEKEKLCISDKNVVKCKKGVKRPGKVKPELADTRPRSCPVKQRKRVRK